MERKAYKLIYQVCPKKDLMESLYYKDYNSCIAVLNAEVDKVNFIVNGFTVFDGMNEALESGSSIQIVQFVQKCIKEYSMLLALDTVGTLDNLDKDLSSEEQIDAEYDLQVCTNYLTKIADISSKELLDFANSLLVRKKKSYPQVKALKKVFAMTFASQDAIKDMANFVEGLINGGEISVYSICESLMDNKPDALMEQMEVIRYLRELYYSLRMPEVNKLQRQIQSILDFGLKRVKK